jgi:two-component system, OmpR family, sensor histidine kinase RstB
LLTYAVLEQGTPSLHLEMIDVDGVLERIKREMDQTGRSIEIEHLPFKGIDESRLAECEQRYIHRALQNLVGNAMKYAKSKVRISCVAQGGMIRVDVEDDGPGIPQDKWESIFAPFARLDSSRTRSSGGYGLGLSIVQRIVFWHGGIVQAHRSNTLGGARFTMIWPRHQQTRVPVSKLEQLDKVTLS